jgi:hypothetical protein
MTPGKARWEGAATLFGGHAAMRTNPAFNAAGSRPTEDKRTDPPGPFAPGERCRDYSASVPDVIRRTGVGRSSLRIRRLQAL